MADGAFLIDSGMNTKGVEKGVELIKKGVKGAADGAERMQKSINNAFAAAQEAPKVKLDKITNQMESVVAKMENAYKRIGKLKFNQGQLKDIISGFGYGPGDVLPNEAETAKELLAKTTEKIKQEQGSISELEKQYQTLAKEREKAAKEIEKAAQRQTKAERQEAEKQKKIAEKQQKTAIKQQTALSKSVGRFGVRLRGIIGSALIFNIISSGLRSMTQYFGNALKANDDFSKALSQLKGALLTAFQPIYNAVAPALTYLVQLATMAVEAIALLFATLSGTTLEESKKAAENLHKQANGYKAAGAAAKKASKQIAAFDEIQQLSNQSSGGGGGNFDKDKNKPEFSFDTLPSELEIAIENIGLKIKDILFNWEDLTEEDYAEKILTGITAVVGGLVGFAVGGAGGAVVGTILGVTIGAVISDLTFDNDGVLDEEEIAKLLCNALGLLVGGVIGFVVGGPGGALLGATIGLGISFLLTTIDWSKLWQIEAEGRKKLWDDFWSAFSQGMNQPDSVAGQAGLTVGTDISLAIGTIDWASLWENEIEGRKKLWNDFWTAIFGSDKTSVDENGDATITIPAPTMSTNDWGVEDAELTTEGLKTVWDEYFLWYDTTQKEIFGWLQETWNGIATWFNDTVVTPLLNYWNTAWTTITTTAQTIWNTVTSIFSKVGEFFSTTFTTAWESIVSVFSSGGEIFTDIKDGILTSFKSVVNKLIAGINSVVTKPFSGINTALRKIKGIDILGIKPFSGISTISVPSIPYLAQGAVLPANKPFMAVLGDQKHGTNVEAPLTTIQEAVANVMDGQTSAILAGFEMSIGVQREILAAVLGIQIGDDAIVQAVSRYNSKMAVVRGY